MSQEIIENGFTFIRQYKLVEAIEQFDEVLSSLGPNNELAYLGKSIALSNQAKHQEAIQMCQKALEQTNASVKLKAFLALEHVKTRNLQEATAIYKELKQADCKDQYDYAYYGLLNQVLNNVDEARKLFTHASSLDPKFAMAYFYQGDLYKISHLGEQAIEMYDRALKCDRNFVLAHIGKAEALLSKSRVGAALKEFNQAIRANPQLPSLHNKKGVVLFNIGRLDEAKSEFNDAIRLDKTFIPAYINKVNILLFKQNYRMALKICDEALKVSDKLVDIHFLKGNIYLIQDKFHPALKCYEAALGINIGYLPAKIQKAAVLKKLNQTSEVEKIQKELLQDTKAELPLFKLANDLVNSGQVHVGVVIYQKVLEINPKFVQAYLALGNAYAALGQHEKALEAFSKALEIKEDYIPCLNNKATTLLALGMAQEAKEILEKIIALDSTNIVALNNLGNVFFAIGDRDQALQYYSKALEIRPGYQDALFNKLLVLFTLEQEKEPLRSQTISDIDPGLEDMKDTELPSYNQSQINTWQGNIDSQITIQNKHDLAKYKELSELPKLLAEKAKSRPEEVTNIVGTLLDSLSPNQDWPEDVLHIIRNSVIKILEVVSEKISNVVGILVDKMNSQEELIPSFISNILCYIVQNFPETATIVKDKVKALLDSDNDAVMISAAKIMREVNKLLITKEATTQTSDILQINFDIVFLASELEEYKAAISDPVQEQAFIGRYIELHLDKGISSEYIVYGLILATSIVMEEYDIVGYILEKDFGSNNILVITDEDSNNPISATLDSGNSELLGMLQNYIFSHSGSYDNKPFCQGKDLQNITNLIHWPQFEEFDRRKFYDEVLAQIYDPDTLTSIIELIGQLAEE